MGEMEVFHVGRMQKAKEGEEICVTKISVTLISLFSIPVFFFFFNMKVDEEQKNAFPFEAISVEKD